MPSSWNVNHRDANAAQDATLRLAAGARPFELNDASARGVFGFDSRDQRSRSFNLLRSQVLKISKARGWKVIGVTSATPNVGKTFVASNLAASLSRIPGQRTLLFDLDLRRGSVARRFGLPEGPGINSYLAGDVASLDEVGLHVQNSGLTIYPSHPTEQSSAEMLAGRRMAALVAAMRSLEGEYLCVCDLPPAFANDDASIILGQIDAYLLVLEEGKTTTRQMRDAIEVLKPTPCMGTVLNRYHGALGGDDYGFGYWSKRSYDDYYR